MPTVDYSQARNNMVDGQVRIDDVTGPALVSALRAVPREAFVPARLEALAYIDRPLEVAPGRFMLDPRTFAKLCQLAEIRPTDSVLDVGCGTGYSAAVLARIAGRVVALESDEALVAEARTKLAGAAELVTGKLPEGCAAKGPYDVILLNGAVPAVPETLVSQLAPNGRLVGVVTDRGVGKAHIFVKAAAGLSGRIAFDATVPLLAGFELTPHFVF